MSPRHGKIRESRRFRGQSPRNDLVGALMKKRKVKATLGLAAFAALLGLFVFNQVTSSSTPTAIYTPGPRQPLAVPTSPSVRSHPNPGTSSTLGRSPKGGVSMIPSSSGRTRPSTRTPRPGHEPGTHKPVPSPTHHPKPPPKPPTPPPGPPPTRQPGVFCRLLGICLTKDSGLRIRLRPVTR